MNPYAINVRPKAFASEKPRLVSPGEIMREISSSQSDWYRALSAYGQNPDPVVKKKGLKIYQEMLQDDQVKACVELRKKARLSVPFNIMPADEDNPEANKYADFIKHVFERMEGTIQGNLYEIYSAIEFGFSLSELNYEILPNGPFAGKIGLKSIKTREPFDYDFKVDEHGNLLGIVYSGVGGAGPVKGGNAKTTFMGTQDNPYPMDKFVIYSYNRQFGNHYGRSDLLAAFNSWIAKKHIMKFWAIFLERYASPLAWITLDASVALKKDVTEAVDDFLKNLSARSGFRTVKGVELTPVTFSSTAGAEYEKSVEAHNRFIAHALLCPNLLGYTQQQTPGSYALGKKHFDAFLWMLETLGQDTTETIVGEQIIARLIDLNFPNVDNALMPFFKFEEIEEESIESRARIVALLSQNGFINQEEPWVREFLTLPKHDPEFALPSPQALNNKPPFGRQREEDETEETTRKEFQEREPDIFERKMKVKEFAKQLDRLEERLFTELTEKVEALRDEIISAVERKGIIESGDPKAVEELKVNVGELKESLRQWLVKIFLDSKLKALEELGRAGVEIEITRKFAEEDAPFEPWNPLPPQEAVDFFNRKVLARIVGRDGAKKLIELASRRELKYYDEKAFAVAGIVRDDILNDAKQVLLNAIKRQDRIGGIKDLKDLFNRYLQQGVSVDDELLQPHRLQTIVRTNMVEAVNEGRRATYEDPDVKDFVQFWEYTAILDDRTTDYCRCMNGKIFRTEDLPLLIPPAHYNCRSFSVPVTRFEVEDLQKQGKGVEVSDPCPDRAQGFAQKDFFIVGFDPLRLKPGELPVMKPNCPYSTCRSMNTKQTAARFNIMEFVCKDCHLPFRVTNTGDLYLFDSGEEKWMRITRGLTPSYFMERNA